MTVAVVDRASADPAAERPRPEQAKSGLLPLALGSVGVVYGDIGTSPLYAFRESLAAAGEDVIMRSTVLGVLSLILWALVIIVTVKYVIVLLRADNNGEGGTLSLVALAQRVMGRGSGVVFGFGVIGAALFYGDAVIAPAVSVLSAVEGTKLLTPAFEPYVVPAAIAILIALFAVQNRGTAKVARLFGPVMVLWFLVIAAGGAAALAQNLDVLHALDPRRGIRFLINHGGVGFIVLGAVFLAVTGAEALYADLGHFGRRPIRLAWLGLALPALTLNYLGQGALVLSHPETATSPFFLLFPQWALLPVVVLATLATVIAAQAVITGAFSLSRQAIQLGLLPRLEIRHTSEHHVGQIYMPRVNWLLLFGVIFAVAQFRSSSALAAAYGIAVTGTMVITAALAYLVMWKLWGWRAWTAALVIGPMLVLDLTFLAANLTKILDGGLFPIILGGLITLVMVIWRRGARVVAAKTHQAEVPLTELIGMLAKSPPHRVKGTAVFLTGDPERAPGALLHNLKHNRVLHEKNVILTIATADRPTVPDAERVTVEPIDADFTRVRMEFGYAETPHVPRGLALARNCGWRFDIMATSFFVSRRSLRAGPNPRLAAWQYRIFRLLARNARDATDFFQIPTGRVVELGTQINV